MRPSRVCLTKQAEIDLDMTVRGAPAIGVTGAYGMVLGILEKKETLKTKYADHE